MCVFVILTLGVKFKFGTLGSVPECACQQPVKEIVPYEVRLWNTLTELLGMFMHCLCILAASNEQKRFEYCFVSSMYNGGVSVSDFGRKSTCVRVHESILFLASAQVLNV